MRESLHIGTLGWDVDAWQDSFYDPALPRDWRFCFFSNAIRAVVVPGASWADTGAEDIARWMEDSDPGFRFVVEVPAWFNENPVADRYRVAEWIALCEGLRPRLAAMLWRVPRSLPEQEQWWSGRLDLLGTGSPLCIDMQGQVAAQPVQTLLARHRVSQCWRPGDEPRPRPGGRYLVTRAGPLDLRSLRTVVETLATWCGDDAGAGLFFEPVADAPRLAREARTIAELLGV